MKPRLPISLPRVETPVEGTFPSHSVVGPFGITAEVTPFAQVLAWQEQKALPFQGYYRLIHHPLLKNLLARLRAYYRVPCAIPYVALASALKELLEYLDLQGRIRITAAPESLGAVVELAGLAGRSEGRAVSVHAGPVPAGARGALSIACFDAPPADPSALDGADFAVVNLADPAGAASGCVVLFHRPEILADIYERNRRRGYTLSIRDAAWLGGGDAGMEPVPGGEDRVLGELCAWENALGGVLYPTGMNALVELFHALCPPGKRKVVVVGHLYSDTHLLFTDLPWAGGSFQATFLKGDEAARVEDLLTPDTGMVFVETITNPLSEVPDLPRLAAACRARGVPLVVDNTMATPYNCKPLDWGADASVHSTTKYFAGGNDHGGGFTAVNNPDLLARLRERQRVLGNHMSCFEVEVLARRLRTFAERMPRFNANGLAVASFLRAHPCVDRVWYCGLEDSPFRVEAQKLLAGSAAVVACSLKDPSRDALQAFYDTSTPSIRKAPSLGSDTTLFCPYVMLTYFKRDDAYLAQYGLPRHLLRFAVGCEPDLAPVLADLDRALRAALARPGQASRPTQ